MKRKNNVAKSLIYL